jgi:hypothetical protein
MHLVFKKPEKASTSPARETSENYRETLLQQDLANSKEQHRFNTVNA